MRENGQQRRIGTSSIMTSFMKSELDIQFYLVFILYTEIYFSNHCRNTCPENSHCEWGFCECDYGFMKLRGRCFKSIRASMMENISSRDITGLTCDNNTICSDKDINSVCGADNKCRQHQTDLEEVTHEEDFIIRCRNEMQYNVKAGECQVCHTCYSQLILVQ